MEFRDVGCVRIPFATNSKPFSSHSDRKSIESYWNRPKINVLAIFWFYFPLFVVYSWGHFEFGLCCRICGDGALPGARKGTRRLDRVSRHVGVAGARISIICQDSRILWHALTKGMHNASRWAKTRNSLCHLFCQKQPEITFSKKSIKIEQLGLRRGLWGHSFKSSYSLELIFDFLEKSVFLAFYIFSGT